MFTVTNAKGINITYPNGWQISVQWGPGNYCDHQHPASLEDYDAPSKTDRWESATAEIAIFNADGGWHTPEGWGDTVKGYLSTAQVLHWMNYTALKKEK